MLSMQNMDTFNFSTPLEDSNQSLVICLDRKQKERSTGCESRLSLKSLQMLLA